MVAVYYPQHYTKLLAYRNRFCVVRHFVYDFFYLIYLKVNLAIGPV